MSATPGRDLAIGAIFAILSGSWDKRAGSTSNDVTRRYMLGFLFLVSLSAASFLSFRFGNPRLPRRRLRTVTKMVPAARCLTRSSSSASNDLQQRVSLAGDQR